MADPAPPAPTIEPARAEAASARLSMVWLIPMLALLISLGVAWRTYSDRGPLIEIVFENAAGIEEGQTALRFRDVTVGIVETVGFAPDLQTVIVQARIEKEVARFLDDTAQFWVVRPSVTAQGVTGIETVLSGIYIQAYWDGEPGTPTTRFTALSRPPLTPAGQPGLRVRLRAPDGGSVNVGAPVLFNRIPVGRIESVELTDAGEVVMDLFVNAPNHLRLTLGTRFWNASGFAIQLGAAGASLTVDSLLSLVQGGVAFDTVGSDTTLVQVDHLFELYPSEAVARANVFEDIPGNRVLFNAFFDGTARGLKVGAPVEFRGVQVGEVTAMEAAILTADGGPRVALRATLAVVPQRLGLVGSDVGDPETEALDFIARQVERGLRARLASAGLLSQTLLVELSELPDAAPATLDRAAEPHPVLPSAPSDIADIAASAEGVLKRLSDLPIEEMIDTAITLLANVNNLVTDERVRAAPENLGLLVADLRTMVSDSGLKDAPAELAAVLAAVRATVEDVTERQLVANVAATLEATRGTIETVGIAAEGLPDLMDELGALSGRAADLPLEDLIAAAARLVDNVDAVVRSEAVTALPAEVTASLAEVRGLLDDLRAGGAIGNVNATLASVRRVADELAAAKLAASLTSAVAAAERTAANVDGASAELPALIEELRALSAKAGALPLEDFIASGTKALASAEALLGSEAVGQVPGELKQALEQVRLLLAELRAGGAVANVNATLASADRAAAAVTAAAADLPRLVEQLGRVAGRADTALASIGPGSDINRDTLLLLREVRDAARSVNALMTALERRPNSVLFGR